MPTSAQWDIGRVSVVTPPASYPLEVDGESGVKKHLRIDHVGEDTELEDLIRAATDEIDAPHGWLGRSLITRTLRLTLDGYPPPIVYLPGPPVTSITKITIRDQDDSSVVIYDPAAPTDDIGLMYDLTAEPALIWPDGNIGWPSGIKGGIDSVRVDYVAGYADADAVPRAIRQWLLMRIGELYRDRETSVLGFASNRLPHADRMLDNWRVRS